MGIEDEWLEEYDRTSRTYFLFTFASMYRRNYYGKTKKSVLKGGAVISTITNMCLTFRKNLRPDPALDADAIPSLFLQQQIRGYIDTDSSTTQHKSLPVSVLVKVLGTSFTPRDEALGQLACGAFFFGMRSWELRN